MTPEQTAVADRLELEGVPRLHLTLLVDTIATADPDTRRALLVAVDELVVEPTPEDEAAIAARQEWAAIDAQLAVLSATIDDAEPDDDEQLDAAAAAIASVAERVAARQAERRAERQAAAAEARVDGSGYVDWTRRAERVAARQAARANPPARNGTKEAWIAHAEILGVELVGDETRDEIIAKVDASEGGQ